MSLKQKVIIKIVKKQLFILGIWTLGAIAGASIINWYYLIPKLQMETEYVQGDWSNGNAGQENNSSVSEDSDTGLTLVENPTKENTEGQLDHSDSSSQSVIKKVAQEEGIDWKLLYAICMKESQCTENRVGDSGKSLGAFQIHQGYQPGTKDCALSLKCSAEWTAKRLKKYAYLGEWEMIRSHNGLVGDRNGDGELDNAYYPNDVLKIMASL